MLNMPVGPSQLQPWVLPGHAFFLEDPQIILIDVQLTSQTHGLNPNSNSKN